MHENRRLQICCGKTKCYQCLKIWENNLIGAFIKKVSFGCREKSKIKYFCIQNYEIFPNLHNSQFVQSECAFLLFLVVILALCLQKLNSLVQAILNHTSIYSYIFFISLYFSSFFKKKSWIPLNHQNSFQLSPKKL